MYILKSQQPSFVNNQLLFQQHKCCVIIPTYNNGRTLKRMVESVLEHCRDVIVVNDGATDETSIILEEFDDQIHLLTHERNLGKGKAIRNGFKKLLTWDLNLLLLLILTVNISLRICQIYFKRVLHTQRL